MRKVGNNDPLGVIFDEFKLPQPPEVIREFICSSSLLLRPPKMVIDHSVLQMLSKTNKISDKEFSDAINRKD